ncbi:unnamed protein product [Rotaria socialis]|uniref:Glycosyltransferase 61 catalytic domain-containing protein n=1 Tax=Rotaria socialis TaxID=392032 RepID=A0A820QVX3_9BILA|nr:unnamed protein product [Rotaria socialis]CAF4427361.1 unnamed protein product [Rotaria socialis]
MDPSAELIGTTHPTKDRKITWLILCIFFIALLVAYYYYTPKLTFSLPNLHATIVQNLCSNNGTDTGWISPSLYTEMDSYLQSIKLAQANLSKILRAAHGKYTIDPFKRDYIQWIKQNDSYNYPYSSWKCTNTSSKDPDSREYCTLINIYFLSINNTYYYYRDPSENKANSRDRFMGSHGEVRINILDNIAAIKQFGVSAILTKPMHVGGAPDMNYAHGFLERCGPLFWVLAEYQSHPSYIDPSNLQIFYSSNMHTDHSNNLWQSMKRLSDGTYEHASRWNKVIYAMFSIYPLLTYQSFNKTTLMFKHMVFTGLPWKRSAAWGIYYSGERPLNYYPFNMQDYRRAYLAFSEWILNNFELPSKFELTPIQKRLQETRKSEQVFICNGLCQNQPIGIQSKETTFTGDWIVVLNRAGAGRREISNANKLVEGLLAAFPDQTNPYLRVWPRQFNFDDNLYETARMARSTRVLIGTHGAGLSNTIFMRPGTILYEINPPGCRMLSFNFRRWAEVFNLQHALWTPGDTNDQCSRDASTTVRVDEIVNDVINLVHNENRYRSGYLSRALDILVKT